MRILLMMSTLLISTVIYGQSCHCSQDTMLNELISCKQTVFDNKAKLFWSFNCDSSWLTFVSRKNNHKQIFSMEKDFVGLTTRLGYLYWSEFKNSFLVTNHVISGCCDPVDYYLYSKSTGNLIKYLGRAIYTSEDRELPLIVSVTNSKYDSTSKTDYNSLTIYNFDTRKGYRLALPKGDIERGMRNNGFMYPEEVFYPPTVENGKLILKYSTQNHRTHKKVAYKTIAIDLKQNSR